MSRSFHNKILRVNLSEGKITVDEPGMSYFRRYMGGWNVIADALLKEVPKGADLLDTASSSSLLRAWWRAPHPFGRLANAVGAESPLTGAFAPRRWAATLALSSNEPVSTL